MRKEEREAISIDIKQIRWMKSKARVTIDITAFGINCLGGCSRNFDEIDCDVRGCPFEQMCRLCIGRAGKIIGSSSL